MASSTKSQQARVDFRVPASVKARLQEAATYATGGDLSAFLVTAGLERAEQVLGQREVLQIDATTRERFYAAMRGPTQPSEALRRLLKDDARFKLVE